MAARTKATGAVADGGAGGGLGRPRRPPGSCARPARPARRGASVGVAAGGRPLGRERLVPGVGPARGADVREPDAAPPHVQPHPRGRRPLPGRAAPRRGPRRDRGGHPPLRRRDPGPRPRRRSPLPSRRARGAHREPGPRLDRCGRCRPGPSSPPPCARPCPSRRSPRTPHGGRSGRGGPGRPRPRARRALRPAPRRCAPRCSPTATCSPSPTWARGSPPRSAPCSGSSSTSSASGRSGSWRGTGCTTPSPSSTPGYDGTLADLAHRWGWYDQAHFTRDFTSLVGVSPGEYRDRPGS